jgi:hypothetical protein
LAELRELVLLHDLAGRLIQSLRQLDLLFGWKERVDIRECRRALLERPRVGREERGGRHARDESRDEEPHRSQPPSMPARTPFIIPLDESDAGEVSAGVVETVTHTAQQLASVGEKLTT